MPSDVGKDTGVLRELRRVYIASARLREREWLGYAVAAGLAMLGLLIRMALGDALQGFPFITFFFAVFISSFLFGPRSGIVATVLGGLLAWYYLIEPNNSFALNSASDAIGLGFYAFTTGVFIFLVASAHQAFADFEASEREREQLNRELESKVFIRTAELELANKQLQQEAESRELAEGHVRQIQKMEAVGQLTGGLAHDFNNMLAVIIAGLNLMQRRLAAGDSNIQQFVSAALDGANRAATLTNRLMAFSRQQPLDPKPINANQLVGGMADLIKRTLGESLQTETVLGAGLWTCNADRAQLESSILNLCVNARDAMPEGGKLTIETANAHLDDAYATQHGVPAGQYVLIAISDTGTGMAAEVLAKVFDPFFTTKAVAKGTGLGLSQVHGFVKQSGGHVKIYSEPGVGTTVKIYLPRCFDAALPQVSGGTKPATVQLPTAHEASRYTILVVEDDDRVREATTSLLREVGYTIVEAGEATAALSQIDAQTDISLLFTDIVMPGMNGRKLADEAVSKRPGLKVLFTTGFTRNAIVHHGVLDPGVNFIAKPFTLEQLAAKIVAILQDGP